MLFRVLTVTCISLGSSTAMAESHLNWSGPYVGGSISFDRAETNVVGNRWTYNQNSNPNIVDHEYTGGSLGAFAGYNIRQDNIVWGAEIGLNVHNLSSDLVFNSDNDIDQADINWSGNLVGRVGVIHNDQMFYAKGGLAFAEISNLGGDMNASGFTLSDAHMREDVHYGAVLGLGLESALSDNLIARFEYSYTTFKGYREYNDDAGGNSQFYDIRNRPIQSVSVGLAFEF